MMHRHSLYNVQVNFESQMESEEASEYMAMKTTTFGAEGILAYSVKHESGLEFRVEASEKSVTIKYNFRPTVTSITTQEVLIRVNPNQVLEALNHLVAFSQNTQVFQPMRKVEAA